MKYVLSDTSHGHDELQSAYVLGARRDSGNIGEAIAWFLYRSGWAVFGDDGAVGDGSRPPGGNIPTDEVARQYGYTITDKGRYQRFEAPSVLDFERADADALIVTLGKTAKTHFAEINDWEISQMIRANLVMPLEAARRFVQASEGSKGSDPDDLWPLRHIVFIGSYAHEHPFTNGTLYCAAKAGLAMAARTLGWELTDRGYRVQTVPAMGWLSGQGLNLYGGSR
jgi:NAD(P)-dependent dehydrogenase (short-subunit alcohol dehydrogenase family)